MAKGQHKHVNKPHRFQTHNLFSWQKHHSKSSFWLRNQLLSKLEIITIAFLSHLTLADPRSFSKPCFEFCFSAAITTFNVFYKSSKRDVLGHSDSVRTEPTPEPLGGGDIFRGNIQPPSMSIDHVGLHMFLFVWTGSIGLQLHKLYHDEDATVCCAAKAAFHHFAVLFVWLRLRTSVRLETEKVLGNACFLFFFFWSPDVNECVTNTRTCQPNERCVNTVGAFMCERQISCSSGYQLRNGECEGGYFLLFFHTSTQSFFHTCAQYVSIGELVLSLFHFL